MPIVTSISEKITNQYVEYKFKIKHNNKGLTRSIRLKERCLNPTELINKMLNKYFKL